MITYSQSGQSFSVYDEAVKQNIHFSENFETRETSYSAQIIHREQGIKYMFSFDRTKLSVMGQIAKLRAHLKRLPDEILNINKIRSHEIKYLSFSKNIQDLENYSGEFLTFDNVIEIDLTAAYFYTALNLGIITPELLNSLLTITRKNKKTKQVETVERPKPDRLKILGSMAVKTEVNEYRDGKIVHTEYCYAMEKPDGTPDERLRNIWFLICKTVDDIFIRITERIPKNDFYFYFVDGIYISHKPEIVSMIQSEFEKNNLPYKKILIDNFTVINKNKRLIIELTKANGKNKKFTVPHREVKHYYTN